MRLTTLVILAATYLVPPDRELIQRSDDIVIATAVATSVEERPDHSIVTRSFLRIEEVLKGVRARDSHLVLTEPGGRLGDRAQIIPAAPRYEPGKRYLVFTETDEQGETHTLGMQLGRFALDRDLALRGAIHGFDPNLEPYRERTRDARGFIDYIRAIVAQRAAEANYFSGVAQAFLPAPQASSPYSRQSYLYVSDIPVRWQDPDVTFVTTGSVASIDWGAATATAMAQWNATDTNIHYRHSGRNDAAANGFTPDGINAVQVHQQSGSGFVLASGGWTTSGNQYTFDDELFYDAAEADVVATDWQGVPLTPACWNSLLTHEIGHTLGIRHSDYDLADINPCTTPPLDCSNDAVMEAFLNCTANGALQPWDRRAATTVYCVPPSITTQPHDQQIGPNNPSVRLSVEAKGTLPITYEWFAKPAGATSFTSAGNGARNSGISATT